MHYVYILQSKKDGSFYTGSTDNLSERLQEHNRGQCKYTSTKCPWSIHWYCVFQNKKKAIEFEKYLKSGSGIAFRNTHLLNPIPLAEPTT
ncbi:MAG: GIY-YIG nuclease family protein [Patescibacteria group bacterium]